MKRLLILSLAAAMLLCACVLTRTGYLHPVTGPLSTQQPPPVYTATASGILSGKISVKLPDGETCTGTWAFVPGSSPGSSLAPAWDAVYGSGFYVSNVLGSKLYARSALSGNRGTHLDLEIYKASNTERDPLIGVAEDREGNVFKVSF
jgi:hypothetical protein